MRNFSYLMSKSYTDKGYKSLLAAGDWQMAIKQNNMK